MRPPHSQSPEQIAMQALRAFEQGDVLAAARDIGRALLIDPHRREWLALLSQIADSVADPVELAPLQPGGVSVGTIAVRAYAMFKVKRYHEAIDLILQAAIAAPHSPLLDWGLAWLKKPETNTTLNCVKIAARLKGMMDDLPRLRALADGGMPLLVRIPQLLQRIRETQVFDTAYLYFTVALLRRLPDRPAALREAYESAREAHELEPGFRSCIALANVYRDREDYDRAARWYQDALEFKPDDVGTRLELGDMLRLAERLDEAEHWFRAALQVQPDHPGATPSLYALRYERTGDEEWKDRLEAYRLAQPENDRAREMWDRIGPYFGSWLPEPAEASLGVVRNLVEKWHESEAVDIQGMALSWLEAPSVHLAYDLQMAREGKRGKLTIEVESVPRPDVRKPRVPVTYQLWRYRGTDPLSALTPPPARATEAVAKIAARPYNLKSWLALAADAAPEFGSGRVRELLAVMVHPPKVPDEFTPWTWVQRAQVAAALIVAKLELAWNGSTRRKALFDVANGPLDWTTIAAILALAALSDDEPNTADDIASLFAELLRDAPEGGYICHLHPLVCAYQRMRNLPPRVFRELAQKRRRLERG